MSSGSFRQADVRCPFYRSDDGKNRIICEGIGEGRTLTSYFPSTPAYVRQMEIFCCCHDENCELYRAIMEKY